MTRSSSETVSMELRRAPLEVYLLECLEIRFGD